MATRRPFSRGYKLEAVKLVEVLGLARTIKAMRLMGA